MNNCNICLEDDNPQLQMIRWHPKVRQTERAHESCVDCVASEVFRCLSNDLDISCPECRRILTLSNTDGDDWTSYISAYSLNKIFVFTATFFGFRYLISPMISHTLTWLFLDKLNSDAVLWANYAEPPLSFLHTEHSEQYLIIKKAMTDYVNAGKPGNLMEAIHTNLEIQKLFTQTFVGVAAVVNINLSLEGVLTSKKVAGIFMQLIHLLATRVLMANFEVTAEDVTHDANNKFSLEGFPPAYNPRRLAKCIEESTIMIFGFLFLFGLSSYAYNRKKAVPETLHEIKRSLQNGSFELKPTDGNAF